MITYEAHHYMVTISGEELCILVQALALLEGAEVDALLHRLLHTFRSRQAVRQEDGQEMRRGTPVLVTQTGT